MLFALWVAASKSGRRPVQQLNYRSDVWSRTTDRTGRRVVYVALQAVVVATHDCGDTRSAQSMLTTHDVATITVDYILGFVWAGSLEYLEDYIVPRRIHSVAFSQSLMRVR